jgi:hypothetical protein
LQSHADVDLPGVVKRLGGRRRGSGCGMLGEGKYRGWPAGTTPEGYPAGVARPGGSKPPPWYALGALNIGTSTCASGESTLRISSGVCAKLHFAPIAQNPFSEKRHIFVLWKVLVARSSSLQ